VRHRDSFNVRDSSTFLAAIATNKIVSDSESWMAVWFFAVIGGVSWLVARAAKNALASS
jgi:hypothetical protein